MNLDGQRRKRPGDRDRIDRIKDEMSQDVLRTRIAYAIAQADGDPVGMTPASCDYEMADAVIADLGLRRASKPNDYDHRDYPPGDRYITDWIATREPRSADKLGLTGDGQ